jgi:hypothetical protein
MDFLEPEDAYDRICIDGKRFQDPYHSKLVWDWYKVENGEEFLCMYSRGLPFIYYEEFPRRRPKDGTLDNKTGKVWSTYHNRWIWC